jgi:hypothetical protein
MSSYSDISQAADVIEDASREVYVNLDWHLIVSQFVMFGNGVYFSVRVVRIIVAGRLVGSP